MTAATLTARTGPTTRLASFAALLHRLPAAQQASVREWYERMGAPSMQGATAAQVAWMRARGYPMPDDIARAAAMSDAELRATANHGNTTARVLLVARQMQSFAARMESTGGYTRWETSALPDVILQMRELLGSGSPFAGYLYAAKARIMHPRNEEGVASSEVAGLVWASKFGDTRASLLLNDPRLQAANAAGATIEMSSMLSIALQVNPNLFSARPVAIPGVGK